ncbi:MAG: 50S ribosomal protein L9 [Candidatus Gracilibacteria bacterium]|nr:50S ribosomal protein L9 [Candidatus Gracilibacteria bacterium]
MEVILQKDVKKLGYRGDIIKVNEGYFRNFLLPKGLAEVATEAVKKLASSRKEKVLMEKDRLLENAKEVLVKLHGLKLTFKEKVSEKGKLFGSLSESDIIKAVLEKANIRLEKEYLVMEHIKEVGKYDVVVKLGEGLEETIKVTVQAAK